MIVTIDMLLGIYNYIYIYKNGYIHLYNYTVLAIAIYQVVISHRYGKSLIDGGFSWEIIYKWAMFMAMLNTI